MDSHLRGPFLARQAAVGGKLWITGLLYELEPRDGRGIGAGLRGFAR